MKSWIINSAGDAIFNNVSVRGAIKTSVFEYSEIQAVGGAFLFRPSVVIKKAVLKDGDVILTLEQGGFFRENDWCKLSNFGNTEERIDEQLINSGLAAIYRVSNVSNNGTVVTLEGAGELFE